MRERPILFSGAMVRAILSGTKTQTRRVVKPNPKIVHAIYPDASIATNLIFRTGDQRIRCPYGQVGDRLWVKETTIKVEDYGYIGPVYVESEEGRAMLEYGLGPVDDASEVEPHDLKLRPSIFMPRSMSRITLEITDVRVDRLQDISEEDARAEGITDVGCLNCGNSEADCGCLNPRPDARDSFIRLWKSINGDSSWDVNPWVWVIEFKRVEQ